MHISSFQIIFLFISLANLAIFEQVLSADIQTIDKSAFDEAVKSNRLVLAHIRGTKDCDSQCNENLRVLADIQETLQEVHIYDVHYPKLLEPYKDRINGLFLYRSAVPIFHEEEELEKEGVLEFAKQHKDSIYSRILNDDVFEHLTQASSGATTGDWFILFYNPECDEYLSLWETLAHKLQQHRVVGLLDTHSSPLTKGRFNPPNCPSALYLRASKYYRFEQPLELKSLLLFAEGWYKNVPAHPITPLPTAFDNLVDSILMLMQKSYLFKCLMVALSILIVLLILTPLFLKLIPAPDHTKTQ